VVLRKLISTNEPPDQQTVLADIQAQFLP